MTLFVCCTKNHLLVLMVLVNTITGLWVQMTALTCLDPGSTPESNMIFLVVLSAIIKAVDTNAKLLRATVAYNR